MRFGDVREVHAIVSASLTKVDWERLRQVHLDIASSNSAKCGVSSLQVAVTDANLSRLLLNHCGYPPGNGFLDCCRKLQTARDAK